MLLHLIWLDLHCIDIRKESQAKGLEEIW